MKDPFKVRGDTLFMTIRGPFDEEMMREALHRIETEILSKYPYYFVIIDGHQMSGFSAAARRQIARWPHLHHNGGDALVGAGLLARTALTMVARAITLFRQLPVPLAFFSTEEEARAWIVRRHQELGVAVPESASPKA